MGRHLEALDGVDHLRGFGVSRLGQTPGALGQAVAEALARGSHLDELEHPPPVAPAEGHPHLALGEPPALERLAHQGERHAHGDGVHAEEIAEVVGAGERARMRVAEHGAEGEDGLVLGHLGLEPLELAVTDLVLLAAGHRALETGGVARVVVGVHLLAGDGEGVGEGLLAEIVGAERAQRVDGLDEEGRPVGGERLGAGHEGLAPLLEELLQERRVGQLRLPRPGHRDGLDALGAQHGGDAAAAGEAFPVLPVGAHGCEAHQALAGGADGHHVGVRALSILDGVDGVAGGLPPERAGGLELGAGLGDLEVDGLGRSAADDDGVEAGALHGGGKSPAEGGVEEEAGERRLAGDAGAAVAGNRGVGDGADGEDHGIGRVVGVGARRHVIEQEARGEAVAAEEASRHGLGDRLHAAPAAREVDVKDAPAVASHGHWTRLSRRTHFSYYGGHGQCLGGPARPPHRARRARRGRDPRPLLGGDARGAGLRPPLRLNLLPPAGGWPQASAARDPRARRRGGGGGLRPARAPRRIPRGDGL